MGKKVSEYRHTCIHISKYLALFYFQMPEVKRKGNSLLVRALYYESGSTHQDVGHPASVTVFMNRGVSLRLPKLVPGDSSGVGDIISCCMSGKCGG